jgi:hypothetical protein
MFEWRIPKRSEEQIVNTPTGDVSRLDPVDHFLEQLLFFGRINKLACRQLVLRFYDSPW